MAHPTAALALIAGATARLEAIGAPVDAPNISTLLGWARATVYNYRDRAAPNRMREDRIQQSARKLRAEITCGADGWTVRLLPLEDA